MKLCHNHYIKGRPDSPTVKSSVMSEGAGFAIDWYAEQAFTISCICRKFATASTSSTFCGLKLSLAVYMNSRTWPKPAAILRWCGWWYESIQKSVTTARLEPTCSIADVQMHHIFLVQEEGAEVDTAGRQHSFVGLKVHPIHNKGAVTQQALLALSVKLLQNLPTVPWELHCPEG